MSSYFDYPSPCDKCQVTNCTKWCEKWEIHYRYRQGQINAYAKKLMGGRTRIDPTKWGYMHPDEYLRYLASDPCEGCICRAWCDNPCMKYMIHFREKMEYLRKRAESRDNTN